jgi:tRNA(Ile)-lysidine synthase
LKGLTGIKPKNSNIIRPLLFALRSEIDSYANEKGIEYRVDSSNAKVKYARNRIRHKVIPELQQINEGVIENLYGSSLFLDQAWQAINIMNIAFRNETRSIVGQEVHYSINKLLNYPFRQLFLVEELAEFGFSAAMVLDIDKSLFTQPGKLFHAANYTLIRDRESLIVCSIVDTKSETVQIESSTQGISSPITLQFSTIGIETKGKDHISKSSAIGAFDYAKLTFPLTLRPWRFGDWFIPFGMKGSKKVSDFLVDLKIPVHQKDSVYVLESNGNIAWVVGCRIDDRFKIESSTQTVFEIVKGEFVDG